MIAGRRGQKGSIARNSYRPPSRLISARELAMATGKMTEADMIRVETMPNRSPIAERGTHPQVCICRTSEPAVCSICSGRERPLQHLASAKRHSPRRFTILEQTLWSVSGQFERRHSREVSTDSATEQKAMKVMAAFAAWEYSHCVLSTSQFTGTTVQLLVALFAGYVHRKK